MHFRYPLRVSVGYRWTNSEGVCCGKGRTRNISDTGAFIVSSDCPAEKDVVNLLFHIPRLRKAAMPSVRLAMEARVVRVEKDRDLHTKVGFAVRKRGVAAHQEEEFSEALWQRGYVAGSRAN